MSSQRSRPQRRSACNRCRTYKLRCERDPRHVDGSCERCRKTGAECVTSATTTATTAANASGNSSSFARANGHGHFSVNARPLSRLAPRPRGDCGSSAITSRSTPEMQPAGDGTRLPRFENSAASQDGGISEGDSPAPARPWNLDFNMSYFTLSDGSREARPGTHRLQEVDWQDFTESSFGDVTVFGDSYAGFASPARVADAHPLSHSLGLANPGPSAINLDPRESVRAWRGNLTPASSVTQVAGSDDSCMEHVSPSPRSHDKDEGRDGAGANVPRSRLAGSQAAAHAPPRNHFLGDVLELSKGITEDHESLDSRYLPADKLAGAIETAVQRALERSSRFCKLLKGIMSGSHSDITISSASASSSSPSSPSRRPYSMQKDRTQQTHSDGCAVLTTSLVTAYILLVRNWRRIFVHLHRLLLDAPSPHPQLPLSGTNTTNESMVIMPTLHVGGFHLQGSPATQVAVLIELSFDMLGQIETGLDIGGWGVSTKRQSSIGGQKPCRVIEGPVSISIREMLLTQETVRLGNEQDELDALPLGDLADQLKSRLAG